MTYGHTQAQEPSPGVVNFTILVDPSLYSQNYYILVCLI